MSEFRRGRVIGGRGAQNLVEFDELDGLKLWLDVAQTRTKGRQSYHRFATGELVRCLIDETGESGEALHAIYTEATPAPADSAAVLHEVLPDGSKLTWDAGVLTYENAAGAALKIDGTRLTFNGDLEVSGEIKTKDLSASGTSTLQDTTINGVVQSGN